MKERPLTITLLPSELYPLVQPLLCANSLIRPQKSTFWAMGFDYLGHLLFMERLISVKPIHLVPSTIFRTAVQCDAHQIVLCQQTVHQLLVPTEEDRRLVRHVMKMGVFLEIPLSDHLMINTKTYRSFKEEGWMGDLAEEAEPID